MSWKEDEWKEDLPAHALGHVSAMESTLEKLQKDISQWRFRTESLTHNNTSLQDKLNEKDCEVRDKERDVGELEYKLNQCLAQLEELTQTLSLKDEEIYRLSAARRKSKNRLDTTADKVAANSEHELMVESGDTAECAGFDDDSSCDEDAQLLEGLYDQQRTRIKQLEELLSQKSENLNFYEEKLSSLEKESEDRENDLRRKNEDLKLKVDTLNADKMLLESRKNCLGNKCYISPRPVDEGEEETKTKETEKDRNIDSNIQVGSYLGIDFLRPSFSDTAISSANDQSNLADENRRLRNELRSMRNNPLSSVSSERVVHVLSDPNAQLPDSGVDLHRTNSEDAKLRMQLEMSTKEVAKLRDENLEMKQVYENHMKICLTQKGSNVNARPSKSELLGTLQTDFKSGFGNLKDYYSNLEHKISEMASKLDSENVSTKLDQIVQLVASNSHTPTAHPTLVASPALDTLKSDLCSNFFSVQDEMQKGHELLNNKIASSTQEILNNLAVASSEDGSFRTTERNVICDEKRTARHHNMFLTGSNDTVGELETMKERLGGVQQAISESINEKRRADLEIERLKDQLLTMVETLKRKNEELARATQQCEKEKGRVAENDARFRKEMAELRKEELEISEEFRNMCETLKKKDIKLANRERDIKMITAERREKEDQLNELVLTLRTEKGCAESDRDEVARQYQEKCDECQTLLKRFATAEEQLRGIFNRLSQLEGVVVKAKADGLY